MCGIFCEVCKHGHTILNDEKILQRLKNRGPDWTNSLDINVNDEISLHLYGTVLWMQGACPTEQPLQNDYGVLLFNGDIFDPTWNKGELSDTQFLFNKLSSCNSTQEIVTVIKSLRGPFSLIYFNKITEMVYFCKDRFGRNSLLFYKNQDSYVISSVLGMKYPCVEVPSTHIYEFDVKKDRLNLFSWENDEKPEISGNNLINDWLKSVKEHQSLPDDKIIPDFDVTLDMNDDEKNIIKKMEDVTKDENKKLKMLENLLYDTNILKIVTDIASLLENSVKIRIESQPSKCKDCIMSDTTCNHCSTGILFSGGLDCTILALLADKYVPKEQPIDLINVAFMVHNNTDYDVPDRKTGKHSYEELQMICSSRNWVFREVNVPKETLEQYQTSVIADLVSPRRTILDESLGTALWFAANSNELNNSSCRVLLLGSGADELFGGYMRHRHAFRHGGWEGLQKELLIGWKRIPYRNLSRDNRVICDHGRQPRLPYLDEDLVDYLLKLKPWLKCFPSANLVCGVGDKLILRLVALFFGLSRVVTLPKRALQFGSRIANKSEKGSDLSKNLI